MMKLLIAVAAILVASTAWAQVAAPATAGADKPMPAATQGKSADTGGTAAKPEATPSATKQRKKAKKSTVKLGVKTGTVK